MGSFFDGQRVLIPGGAGLIGQAITRQLVGNSTAEITATEWRARKIIHRAAVNVVSGIDLATTPELQSLYAKQDTVIWCAAMVGGSKSMKENASELIHYNLEMASRNIYAAVKAGVKRFCYISSSYVNEDSSMPVTEGNTRFSDVPMEHYGLGWLKRYMETLCRHHHMTSNTRFCLVRPTGLYGPHDDFNLETCHAVPALVRKFVEAQTPIKIWGNGDERRQFTWVDDFAKGLLTAVENYSVCEPINIATKEVNTILDVAVKLARITNVGLYELTGSGPTVIKDRLADVSKAKRLLNVECDTTLLNGLGMLVDWYKENRVA